MWINLTQVKVAPSDVDTLRRILFEEALPLAQRAPGYRFALLVQANEAAGECTSITGWENELLGTQYFNSPLYLEIVGQVQHLLVEAPQRSQFRAVDFDFSRFAPLLKVP